MDVFTILWQLVLNLLRLIPAVLELGLQWWLLGIAMRESGGRANPKTLRQLLENALRP